MCLWLIANLFCKNTDEAKGFWCKSKRDGFCVKGVQNSTAGDKQFRRVGITFRKIATIAYNMS
jgi:hypothetical protein